MLNMLHKRARSEKGFTLIELLVVILIIGILAAIALPAFLGQRAKAQDSSAKSDARNMVSQMESYYVEGETYALGALTAPPNTGLPVGAGSGLVSVTASGADTYTILATSKSGNTFTIEKNTDGTVDRTCVATKANAGCPASLTW